MMTTQSESHFWDKFIYKTASYNIKPDVARWYVRHAESFIKSQNKRLAMQTAADVDQGGKRKERPNSTDT